MRTVPEPIHGGNTGTPACWAVSLGECSIEASKEHLVSRSVWNRNIVNIAGFPWCDGETRRIGADSLASHILCRRHNNLLSDLDKAASRAINAFRQSASFLASRRKAEGTNWDIIRFGVPNANDLERWFLKTAINLATVGVGGRKGYVPPINLVRMAFGLDALVRPKGLYAVAKIGDGIRDFDVVGFAPLWRLEELVGGLFRFRDFKFVLWLAEATVPRHLDVPSRAERDWHLLDLHSDLVYHVERINLEVRGRLSHYLQFEWSMPTD